jgi:hypothetical protein
LIRPFKNISLFPFQLLQMPFGAVLVIAASDVTPLAH